MADQPSSHAITLRVSADELAHIDRAAAVDGISRNEWIKQQCEERSDADTLERYRGPTARDLLLKHALRMSFLVEKLTLHMLPSERGAKLVQDARSTTTAYLENEDLIDVAVSVDLDDDEAGS